MTQLTHGGDWAGYRAQYGHDALDFSANVSPLGLPQGVANAIAAALPHADRYPDPLCRALRAKLAPHEGIPAESILCGNGAADLIFRLAWAAKPRTALVTAPTFAEYAAALESAGCAVRRHFLQAEVDFAVTDSILSSITPEVDMVFLCQPNNPTGQLTPLPLVERILRRCEACGALLVVDECFLDFLPDCDTLTAKALLDSKNLLILKAFTKLYGMAGVRLGYCLCADNALLRRMAAASPPWNVSSPAQSAGVAALAERDFLQRTLSLVHTERRWLTDNLTALGFWVCPSHANYLLFRGPLGLREGLLQQGIAIRGCGNYNGLGDGWYRIAVRPHGENEALITAIRQFCKEKSLWQ
jgi:threonine-phosphate decarboxylase